jgi:hypothetical protein
MTSRERTPEGSCAEGQVPDLDLEVQVCNAQGRQRVGRGRSELCSFDLGRVGPAPWRPGTAGATLPPADTVDRRYTARAQRGTPSLTASGEESLLSS